MQIKFYSFFVLPLLFAFALIQNDCNQNSRSASSSSQELSSTRNSSLLNGLATVGRLKFAGFTAGIQIDGEGKTSFVAGYSPVISFGLGPLTFEVAVSKTIPLTENKPHQLFIIVENANGQLTRYQYDIGQEFQFEAEWVEKVMVVNKNDCTIIVIKNPKIYSNDQKASTSKTTTGNYVVDTRNDSGLHLRAEKNIESKSMIYVPENEPISFLGCESKNTTVSPQDRRTGRWCRAEYNGVEGWAWGWYIRELTE